MLCQTMANVEICRDIASHIGLIDSRRRQSFEQKRDDKREGMDFLGRPKFGIIPQKKSKF